MSRLANDPGLLSLALIGQFSYTMNTDKMSAAMRIAERVYLLAQEQNDALMIGPYAALSCVHYHFGDFESGRQYAMRGVRTWRSGNVPFSCAKDYYTPVVACLCHGAMSEWHLGRSPLAKRTWTKRSQ